MPCPTPQESGSDTDPAARTGRPPRREAHRPDDRRGPVRTHRPACHAPTRTNLEDAAVLNLTDDVSRRIDRIRKAADGAETARLSRERIARTGGGH